MSQVINALYDSRAEAEVARARLASEIGLGDIRILSKTNEGELDRLQLSDADRKSYSEGLRNGSVLLTAKAGKGHDAERVVRILKEAVRGGHPVSEKSALFSGNNDSPTVAERSLPLAEEHLRIGKREVVRGGARVQSHVREVPAEADVTLAQERLHADRRMVSRALSDTDVVDQGVLKPRVVEISEMREEAVITKRAFVREEVVIRKTVEQRTETIRDTVRKTEVDVEEYRIDDPIAGR